MPQLVVPLQLNKKAYKMQIGKNKVVGMEYTLTNNAGDVLDTSQGRAPLYYIQGIGALIPGLEEELEGKEAGFSSTVKISADKAYGPVDEQLVHRVAREQFQTDKSIEVGMTFQSETPQGVQQFIVRKVEDDFITIDANHPLAGQELTFNIDILEVREATESELNHGHVHGPGGHEH